MRALWHCGQKRSNDLGWSEKVIDLGEANFDILAVHNYEYEPERFEPGLPRIRDYLELVPCEPGANRAERKESPVLEQNITILFGKGKTVAYDW